MEQRHQQNESERELILRCQNGDESAFDEIYRIYSPDVFSMSLRMVNSEDIAEEVTQEVFISIYKNIGRFQFQSAFTTWVYRIVIRRAADYFRKNKKHMGNHISLQRDSSGEVPIQLEEPGPNPSIHAQEKEKEEIIFKAISQLKENQKTILILRYMKHLQYEEIAEILQCRVGTVKSRLNRAHKSLENVLRSMNFQHEAHD